MYPWTKVPLDQVLIKVFISEVIRPPFCLFLRAGLVRRLLMATRIGLMNVLPGRREGGKAAPRVELPREHRDELCCSIKLL